MATPTTLPAAFVAGDVLTAAQMNDLRGAFRVLQVVFGQTSTPTTNSTNVAADTGLTATITPTSTTSKVLVILNQNGVYKSPDNSSNGVTIALVRGATNITFPAAGAGNTNTAIGNMVSVSATYLDSPATTSATTYKTQFYNTLVNGAAVGVQTSIGAGAPASYMVLMEISA
jgi:hypothetical protein